MIQRKKTALSTVFSAVSYTVGFILFTVVAAFAAEEGVSQEERARNMVELSEITVTAQKQEESVLEVPANVTVMDGYVMEDLGIANIDELTDLAPNINVDKIDSHVTQVVFRGIGGMTNMNKIWNINVDGVTVPYAGVDMFLDVERVELMRGSQGSLYGRNTHAGVVNVITRKPTPEFSFDSALEIESYNTQKVKAAFGGPVSDNQGYRLALGYTHSDGYMDNAFLGSDDGSRHEQFSGRFTYELAFSEDNLLRLSVTGDAYDGGFDEYVPVARGASTTTMNDEEGKSKGHLFSPTLTWERVFGDLALTSITNYSASNSQTVFDQDSSPFDLMVLDYDEDFKTFTQEVRLSGGESSDVEWLAGVFLLKEEIDLLTDFRFGNDAGLMLMPPGLHMIGDGVIDSQGAALFGQVIVQPLEKLELRARLRLDYEERELTWQGRSEMGGVPIVPVQDFSRKDDWFGVMPSASLAYIIDDRQRVYGSIDRGYKVGDYAANQVDIEAVREPVDPEYTLTYEIGYKGLLADKRLELSAAAFYIDWTDMQVSVVKDNVALMHNAAEAHSYGLELEARWRAARGLDLLAGFGWLKGEFDRYDNHPSGQNMAGNQLPNANEYSFSMGARYRHDNGFFTSLSAALMGPKYLDEQNLIKQDSYTLLNAKIGYEATNWAAYVYGRNLLDEAYLVHSFTDAGRAGEPAVVGAECRYYF